MCSICELPNNHTQKKQLVFSLISQKWDIHKEEENM